MHELSIVMNIIGIASRELEKSGAEKIDEIELDIGEFSTIEPAAFEFAWEQAIRNTPLENAEKRIHYISGLARCSHCQSVFSIRQLYDPCPECGMPFHQLIRGKEIRVKSMLVS